MQHLGAADHSPKDIDLQKLQPPIFMRQRAAAIALSHTGRGSELLRHRSAAMKSATFCSAAILAAIPGFLEETVF